VDGQDGQKQTLRVKERASMARTSLPRWLKQCLPVVLLSLSIAAALHSSAFGALQIPFSTASINWGMPSETPCSILQAFNGVSNGCFQPPRHAEWIILLSGFPCLRSLHACMVLDIPLGLQKQNAIKEGTFLIGLLSSKPQCGYIDLKKERSFQMHSLDIQLGSVQSKHFDAPSRCC
jgi:hypothetical protein